MKVSYQMKNLFLLNIVISVLVLSGCSMDTTYTVTDPNAKGDVGTGGSTARFAIVGNYLYTVDRQYLKSYDISIAAHLKYRAIVKTNDDNFIETIASSGKALFIGTSTGVGIFGLSTPGTPKYLSTFQHIMMCDPVVANDKFAFVTLRSSSSCYSSYYATNELQIFNIQDLSNPQLVQTITLNKPYGLGLLGKNLFICDNTLKQFNIADPANPVLLNEYSNYQFNDIIPFQPLLLGIGDNGFIELKFDSLANTLSLLSKIQVNN